MHTGILWVIYSMLNTSVIIERKEMHLKRNETRGGNLNVSGTLNSFMIIKKFVSYNTLVIWVSSKIFQEPSIAH